MLNKKTLYYIEKLLYGGSIYITARLGLELAQKFGIVFKLW